MEIFKFFSILLLILIFFVLNLSLTFIFKDISLVFVLIIVLAIIYSIKMPSNKNIPYNLLIFFAWAGILLDIYSIFPKGLMFLSLFLSACISYKFIVQKLNLSSSLNIFITGFLMSFVWQIFFLGLNYIYYFFNLLETKININEIYISNIFLLLFLQGFLVVFMIFVLKMTKFNFHKS
ncbi:hypothetical protein ISS06_00675 [Patescibacteria group bacterium]|nr:hypothetical protein [Patescibacteria group bacterium]